MAKGSKYTKRSKYISVCFEKEVFEAVNNVASGRNISFSLAVNKMVKLYLIKHNILSEENLLGN